MMNHLFTKSYIFLDLYLNLNLLNLVTIKLPTKPPTTHMKTTIVISKPTLMKSMKVQQNVKIEIMPMRLSLLLRLLTGAY